MKTGNPTILNLRLQSAIAAQNHSHTFAGSSATKAKSALMSPSQMITNDSRLARKPKRLNHSAIQAGSSHRLGSCLMPYSTQSMVSHRAACPCYVPISVAHSKSLKSCVDATQGGCLDRVCKKTGLIGSASVCGHLSNRILTNEPETKPN